MNRLLTAFVAASAVLASGMSLAEARELRVGPAAPPAHPANSHLYQKLVEYLPEESGGALTARIFGPEVVSLPQIKDALQSQVIEIGNLLPLYFPAELPNMAMAGELALSGREPHVMGAAVTEFIVTCAACIDEMKGLGVVYLGSGSSGTYHVLSTKPINTAEDLKGLRLRSGGAPFSRWAEHFGAVPVSLPVGDTFESISQGTIDGSIASLGDLLSYRLVELVKSINMVVVGTYHATSNFTVAEQTWGSLSVDERKALARAANRANADFTQRWGYEIGKEAETAANEAGIEFVAPDAGLTEAAEAYAQADQSIAAELSRDRFNMDDADQRVARFLELVEKWTAIVEETGPDANAIAAKVQEEVWDKVDFSTYGL